VVGRLALFLIVVSSDNISNLGNMFLTFMLNYDNVGKFT